MMDVLSPASSRLAIPLLVGCLTLQVATLSFPVQSDADSVGDWKRMLPISPRGYLCVHVDEPIQVDGRIDERSWREAAWTEDFSDIEGARKAPPRFRTRAKMLWDDRYFYVAAQLQEPHVWGTLKEHDSVIFHDNDFEVFIDPNGDNHEYYELELNALNTTWDLFLPRPYKDGGRADNRWEIPGLKTAVFVGGTLNDPSDEDRGWSVEIAIPWKVLAEFAHQPSPPEEGDRWRVNFSRVQWRHQVRGTQYRKVPNKREDNWVWSPQGIVDMHRPERWGYVQFSRTASGTKRFQADPALPARDALMTVYHHQKTFFQRHKRWAQSLQMLGLRREHFPQLSGLPGIEITPDGFRASVPAAAVDGSRTRWHVQHDSRLWAE